MRKKVLFSFPDLGLGGIQTKIISLTNELAARGAETIVVIANPKSEFDRQAFLHKKVQKIYLSQKISQITPEKYHRRLLLEIIFRNPDAIFLPEDKVAAFIIPKLKWFPWLKSKVVTNIDTYLPGHQVVATKLLKASLEQSDSVVAVSADTFLDLQQRFELSSPPLMLIRNWVDAKKPTAAMSLGYHQRIYDFVYMGRFVEQKRPEWSIYFIWLLKKLQITRRLDLYGEGKLYKKLLRLRSLLSLEKQVFFHKPTPNPDKILQKSKYLLLPSRYEGLPFIALEAMQNGCVVFATNVPGNRDVVVDGRTGFLKKRLTDLVLSYIVQMNHKSRYKKMQTSAKKRLKKYFSSANKEKLIRLLVN